MNLSSDIKYSLRVLRRKPWHSLLSTLIAALSVSLSVITLVVVYNAWFKPLQLPQSDRWVHLSTFDTKANRYWGGDSVDFYRYQYLRQHTTSFQTLGVIRANAFSRLHDGNTTVRIRSGVISPDLVQASGIEAELGRMLLQSDADLTEGPAVVISHALWVNHFAQDPNIVGRTLQLDESPHTVVGVMPAGAYIAGEHQAWISMPERQLTAPNIRAEHITPIGVLRRDVSIAEAQAEIDRLVNQLNAEHPEFYDTSLEVRAVSLHLRGSENGGFVYLAVSLVACGILLLGGLNLSNLSMVRLIERSRELAIRGALGSSKSQLLSFSIIESTLLSMAGAGIGLVAASLCLSWFGRELRDVMGSSHHWDLGLSNANLLIGFTVTALVWLVSIAGPLLRVLSASAPSALGGDSRARGNTNFSAAKFLVAIEVIASCFLLVVTGALFLAIEALLNVDYGIDTKNRVAVEMEISREYQNSEKRNRFFETLTNELTQSAAIDRVALTTALPNDIGPGTYRLLDREYAEANYPTQFFASISPSYTELFDIDIVEGRGFSALDNLESERVVLVDERFANEMWPSESALGKQIQFLPEAKGPVFTIVGVTSQVVPHVRYGTVVRDSIAYGSILQQARGRLHIVMETERNVGEVFSTVSSIVRGLDPTIAIYNPRTLETHLSAQTKDMALLGRLLSLVALVTLFLTITGVFAVISRTVSQQTRDIGVRRAVGSSAAKILWLYLRQGLNYLVWGVLVGGGAAILVNDLLSTFFANVASYTPAIFVAAATILGLMICSASLIPTRTAIALEPGDALRYE